MFHFEQHSFDPGTGELGGPRGSTRLQPKPARLLTMLLEAGGELVAREDIRASLWPDINVDFDAGLNTCVRQIRAALTDTGGEAEWIETLPKRGYRIGPAVEWTGAGGQDRASATSAATTRRGSPRDAALRRRALPYVVMFLLLAVITSAVLWNELLVTAVPSGDPSAASREAAAGSAGGAAEEPVRLAVLPFVDPEAEEPGALNRSLTEAYVAALVAAAPGEIVVVGPATTGPLRRPGVTLPQVAAAVDADFVMHGGRRASDSMFFVEVVHPDGGHLFARRFELPADRAAEAPADLIAAIATAIREARSP